MYWSWISLISQQFHVHWKGFCMHGLFSLCIDVEENSILVIAINQSAVPLSAPAKEIEFLLFSLSHLIFVAVHYNFKVTWLVEVSIPWMIFVGWLAYISLIEARDHTPPICLNWLSVSFRQGKGKKLLITDVGGMLVLRIAPIVSKKTGIGAAGEPNYYKWIF